MGQDQLSRSAFTRHGAGRLAAALSARHGDEFKVWDNWRGGWVA